MQISCENDTERRNGSLVVLLDDEIVFARKIHKAIEMRLHAAYYIYICLCICINEMCLDV